MIVVTAATGKLGTHVVNQLLEEVPAGSLRLAVRTPSKAAHWADRGVEVVQADYEDPASLRAAFEGAERVLLISSSAFGQRLAHHGNAIEAAVDAGVGHLVYTSLLNADSTSVALADEHVPTERMIVDSGLSYTILRNGWYTENYTENLDGPIAQGAFYGAAQDGRISAATRADFAAASVTVLTDDGHEGKVYELGGDSFTMSELAATVSQAVGKDLSYVDMPESAYRDALLGAGLPEPLADLFSNADAAIARGDLETDSGDLQRLIGRAATPLAQAVDAALA